MPNFHVTCIKEQTGVGRIVTKPQMSTGISYSTSLKLKTYWPNFQQVQLKDGKTISKKHNTVQSSVTLEVPGFVSKGLLER